MRMGPRLLLMLAALLVPWGAGASVFDQFGFEPRGVAMGGAQVAAGDGHVAAYFNPSMLALSKEASVGLGVAWAQPVMDVHTLELADHSRLRLAGTPPDYGGITLGALFPMGGKVGNRVALGIGLYAPTNNILRSEGTDPALPTWYYYHSSPDRIILAASLGVRVLDWLFIGGGAQFLGAFIGGFDSRVNLFNQTIETRALKNDLAVRVSPLAGFTLDFPAMGLRAGFGYRAPIQLDIDFPNTIDIADVGTIDLQIKGVVHYSPHTFTLGVRYCWGPLTAAAELRYALWSRAPDPSIQADLSVDSDVLAALGADERFDASSAPASPGFSDTLEPHLGVEWYIVPRFAVRLGYSFRPTPVPLQNGDTNILDGNTHAFGAGLGFNFDDPLEVFTKPVRIDLAYQLLLVAPERTALKGGDSSVPSYAYSGHVNNVSAAVRYVF
ncbi:MAG: hypothetical protein HY901_27630 [Deltaproteobacteria bacterium]|nr:hypothetical protein [Deltaproteobacteria bacterium]